MDPAIQSLIDQASQNETVEGSAVIIIKGIANQITIAIQSAPSLSDADRATLLAQTTALKASSDALAAAVVANTPAAAPAPTAS